MASSIAAVGGDANRFPETAAVTIPLPTKPVKQSMKQENFKKKTKNLQQMVHVQPHLR